MTVLLGCESSTPRSDAPAPTVPRVQDDAPRAPAASGSPRVLWSGCAQAGPGPSCTLSSTARTLTVWADVPESTAAQLTVDGEAATMTTAPVPVEDGWRWSVAVPPGAARLEVSVVSYAEPFVLSLETRDHPESERLAAIGRAASDDPAGARQQLAAFIERARGVDRVKAYHLQGTWAWMASDRAAYQAAYGQVVEQGRDVGLGTLAGTTALLLAFDCIEHYEFDCARAWLLEDAAARPPTPLHDYYQGLMSEYRGQLDDAARAYLRALHHARALGTGLPHGTDVSTMSLAAHALAQLGQHPRAHALLEAGLPLAESLSSREHATFLSNAAWTVLVSRARIGASAPVRGASLEPAVLLHRAVALLGDAPTPGDAWITARLNLAYEAVLRDDAPAARRWLTVLEPHPLAHTDDVWRRLLWARVERLEGSTRKAQRRLATLLADAERYDDHSLRWATRVDLAIVLEQQGQTERALAQYAAAEEIIEQQLPRLGLSTRARFMAERGEATSRRVALLLVQGQVERALCVARLGRTRVLRALDRRLRLGRRSDRSALLEYIDTRLRLEQEHEQTFADADAARAILRRRELERERASVEERFDALMRAPGDGAAEVDCESLPAPERGAIDLHFVPLEDGWVGFAVDERGQVRAARLGSVPESADLAALGPALLSPFEEAITSGASVVRVMAQGDLYRVPFHALPFGEPGRVLQDQIVVVYGLDLPERAASAGSPPRALVLAPPSNLPHVRAEAEQAWAALAERGEVQRLPSQRASGGATLTEQVLTTLPRVSWLHYVGHARSGDTSGWDSELRLAPDGTMSLGVSEILALAAVPATVVLSGCQTGVLDPQSLGGGMSLAHAFVLAGASTVIATTEEVRDDQAVALMRDFYASLARLEPDEAASAMRRAQQDARARRGAAPTNAPAWRLFRTWVP